VAFLHVFLHHLQCEFPVIYASGFQGIAGNSPKEMASDMEPLFQVGGVHVDVA
jgi:predicted membrane GTPase involved in stress response